MQLKHFAAISLLASALPALCFSAAITANATCEVGTCASPDSITGATTSTGSFNFNLTLGDGDTYNVSGSFANSYDATGSHLGFFPTIQYLGTTPSVSTDVISLDMLQNIFDPTPGSWDGTYNENIPFNLPAGVSATGQVFYNGGSSTQGVGLVSASGPGFTTTPLSANLTGLGTANTLVTDYNLTFTFAAGTTQNTSASSPVIPEPAETIPAALALAGLIFWKRNLLKNASR